MLPWDGQGRGGVGSSGRRKIEVFGDRYGGVRRVQGHGWLSLTVFNLALHPSVLFPWPT